MTQASTLAGKEDQCLGCNDNSKCPFDACNPAVGVPDAPCTGDPAAGSMADTRTVGEARRAYFAANGFAADGGYTARWVTLAKRPIAIGFPNFAARVRAVRCHDVHHIVTGYPTSWIGESEISAWELASGCRDYWAAWLLNLGGMMIGLFLDPRAVFRAAVRGRHTRNVYGRPIDDALLAMTVERLRHELGLDQPIPPATLADTSLFAGLIALSALVNLAGPTLLAWLLWP